MRLVTWNCCHGKVAAKSPPVLALAPDVLVMQECARPGDADGRWVWAGENPNHGIGVWARPEYRMEALPPLPGVPRYAIPVQVSGPHPFLLIAVWAMNEPEHPYVRALIRALELYRPWIEAQPTVVMGDFNANAIWNRSRPGARDHAYLVRLLGELGLVSSYHRFTDEEFGRETQPTLYLLRNERKPYHIDYCYIPEAWAASLTSVSVGGYAEWAAWSDHRPLVVDLAD
ncbi:MAG: hypothetical protein JWM27_3973 [Gemmatimonadetes bacterium]|nr:hypothetical protein [Gemmatimonadota bacterium]